MVVAFGPFTLNPALRSLTRAGERVPLSPKAMDVLLALLESPGTVVSKADLMARVWPDTFVEEGNLPVTVFALRKALGDTDEQYIRTVTKAGYAFVAPVSTAPAQASAPSALPDEPVEPALGRPSHGADAPPASPTDRYSTPVPTAVPVESQDSPVSGLPARKPGRGRIAAVMALATVLAAVSVVVWTRTNRAEGTRADLSIGSIAVLPFTVMDGSPSDALLGAGLAADIVDHLSSSSGLRVRPLSSTLKFVDARDSMKAASALKADAALTGSVRMTDAGVEVSADLMRASDGARVWSMPSRRRPIALPVAGSSVASELAAALVSPPDKGDTGAETTRSDQAYRAYLDGLALANELTVPEMARAIEQFETAVVTDPAFADAHAALARFSLLPVASSLTPARLQRARLAASRALALNPRRGGPHGALAVTLVLADGKWSDGLEETRQAIALEPNDPELRLWHAMVLSAQGNHDEGLREIGLALALDPASPRINLYRGVLLSMARRYDEAIAQFRQTPLELGVVNQQVYFGIGLASAKKTRYDLAEAAVARVLNRVGNQQSLAHMAFVYAESGDKSSARAKLDEALRAPTGAAAPHTIMAATQACLGDLDAAFERLRRGRQDGDLRVMFAKVDPALDCARSDPRYPAFLRSLGLSTP